MAEKKRAEDQELQKPAPDELPWAHEVPGMASEGGCLTVLGKNAFIQDQIRVTPQQLQATMTIGGSHIKEPVRAFLEVQRYHLLEEIVDESRRTNELLEKLIAGKK